ncbi:MAG TPA: NgoFVII family restriction endonuclease [bacterium]|nr:NgoFVII family restriction endonuclease [bacterium]
MPLLFSNLSPLRTRFRSYPDVFRGLLQSADQVKIATGYISTDSIVDINKIIIENGGPRTELCVGMHYFEGLTAVQAEALANLNTSLQAKGLGEVHMVTTFPFHGKIVCFSKNDELIGSIIGSSNLSNIIDGQRQYEADFLFDDSERQRELSVFIGELIGVSSKPFESLKLKIVEPKNDLLNDQVGVYRATQNDVFASRRNLSKLTFNIPLKGDESPKSNLNVYFGEGRRNQQGFVIPRSWYEIELIVSKSITEIGGYPRADSHGDSGAFDVITDDGWEFRCKVSGDYSKNFRSESDLKVLGKWIKGRLEYAGVLNPGEMVTDEVLNKYGRSNISLTKISNSSKWYLDFGVNRNA